MPRPGSPTPSSTSSADLKDWVKTDVFQTDSSKVARVTVEMPGEQPLKIERNADKKLTVAGIPQGQKLKEEGTADFITRAAANIDFDDVRKQSSSAAAKDVSTIKLETDNGLDRHPAPAQGWRCAMAVGDAAGEGDAKKAADEITARTAGLGVQDLSSNKVYLSPQAPRRPASRRSPTTRKKRNRRSLKLVATLIASPRSLTPYGRFSLPL